MSLGCPGCGTLETDKHRIDCPNIIVGYFAWVNINGKHFPEKYGADRVGMNAEATKYYADRTVGSPIGLTAKQWRDDSLDTLAARNPLELVRKLK